MERKNVNRVKIGDYEIGADNPVRIQSMLNIPVADTKRAVDQALSLKDAGCEIIRVAVNDAENAEALNEFIPAVKMPVVADIHFDYRLALAAIEKGVAKVRLNPGNIGSKERVKLVCDELKRRNIPVRIGINSGSLEADLLEKYKHPTAEALVESAERSIGYFNEFDYDNIVVSIKSSDVVTTYNANMLFRQRFPYPLHLGITEAGSGNDALVRGSIGIGSLLLMGIGETIRVSLTGDPINEIYAAKDILSAVNMRTEGIRVISCPTCGRTKTDILPIVNEIKEKTKGIKKTATVAVMGCVVNGPGEAREADLGVACGINEGVLFIKGNIIEKVKGDMIAKRLLAELDKL